MLTGPGEQIGDAGDLGQPRRGGADLGRRGGDIDQLHTLTLARGSDISQQVGEDSRLHRFCRNSFRQNSIQIGAGWLPENVSTATTPDIRPNGRGYAVGRRDGSSGGP